MRYGILILFALFGVVGVAVVRTYQLNSTEPSSPTQTPSNSSPVVLPSPTQNQVRAFEIRGTLTSAKDDLIVVDGRNIVVTSDTEVKGKLKPKMRVRVQGFILANGTYVASEIAHLDGEGGD